MSTKRQRIAELAKRKPKICFTALNHYIDMEWMREAYRRLRKDSAPGVSGQTVEDYGRELNTNLETLIGKAKSGSYFAPPVKRVYIPKGTKGETRPIGIQETEDKLLQRAITMLMEPIYEQDFLECSYGFRPNRSAHDALRAIWEQCMDLRVRWILDIDIRKFFDTLVHKHLRRFLELRVRDGVITRLIGKWLNAGVLEHGTVHFPKEGTTQGQSISPLLSNIYLHYVLDLWFELVVKPRLHGGAFMVRFADDVAMGFASKEDAEKVLEVLPKRLGKFGLSLHEEKTRMISFGPPGTGGKRGTGTFDFLGFTHYWGKSWKGAWVIKRKTAKGRLSRALKRVSEWCRRNRHAPVAEQHVELSQKLRGHYAYYGVTNNDRWVTRFWHEVKGIWRKWLNRRSWKSRMPWEKFYELLKVYHLPEPRVVHDYCAAKP